MASLEDIATLRELINEPDDSNGWTDERLGGLLDSGLTLNGAAGRAWVLKAGQYSTLVDVAESGSSRKLGDMHKNALAMAARYQALEEAEGEAVAPSGPIIQRIRRGFS